MDAFIDLNEMSNNDVGQGEVRVYEDHVRGDRPVGGCHTATRARERESARARESERERARARARVSERESFLTLVDSLWIIRRHKKMPSSASNTWL